MPEHLLDGPKVGAVLKQVCRERMPEHVRRDLFLNASLFGPSFNHLPESLTTEPAATSVQEQRLGLPTTEPVTRLLDIAFDKTLGDR